jgi:hypothetical protein
MPTISRRRGRRKRMAVVPRKAPAWSLCPEAPLLPHIAGRQGEALQIWREILGDYFPLS